MRGLRFLADDIGLGAGAAIILFTVAIRVVLLPLTLQQIKSQKAMQKLQPEIKALQKMQNQMMQFMPLMMLWFGLSFSSALALYWVTQNVFGIVQQYFSTGWGSLLPLLPNRGGPVPGATGSIRASSDGATRASAD